MAFAYAGAGALDYLPCQYGTSKLQFRGPRRDLDLPHVVALGGTETYGKFIRHPWPKLVEEATGLRVVNLGLVNAGADAYLSDPGVMQVVAGARVVVLQLTGAGNLSNRFYAVHPRRNDRFLRALPPLMQLYPEVDFTNFHFTRHLLRTLQQVSPRRFDAIATDLRATWVARMRQLVECAQAPVILLWMAVRPPGTAGSGDLSADPILVDQAMVAALRSHARDHVEVLLDPVTDPEDEGMAFAPMDRPAAAALPGPRAHDRVADAVAERLDLLWGAQATDCQEGPRPQ